MNVFSIEKPPKNESGKKSSYLEWKDELWKQWRQKVNYNGVILPGYFLELGDFDCERLVYYSDIVPTWCMLGTCVCQQVCKRFLWSTAAAASAIL